MQEIQMHHGETSTLTFTFTSGVPADYVSFEFAAWKTAGGTPWGVAGVDGDGVYTAAGAALSVKLAKGLTEPLTVSVEVENYTWDLRGITAGAEEVVLAYGALELRASPTLSL